jgi:hypothetical protein
VRKRTNEECSEEKKRREVEGGAVYTERDAARTDLSQREGTHRIVYIEREVKDSCMHAERPSLNTHRQRGRRGDVLASPAKGRCKPVPPHCCRPHPSLLLGFAFQANDGAPLPPPTTNAPEDR